MKNIIVQFDGSKYRLFESQQQSNILGIAHSLDEVKTLLSQQFESPPKVGDTYYYVEFGEDFRSGSCGEVREAKFRQSQIEFIYSNQKLPLNVYRTPEQAASVMRQVTALFRDMRGKWDIVR